MVDEVAAGVEADDFAVVERNRDFYQVGVAGDARVVIGVVYGQDVVIALVIGLFHVGYPEGLKIGVRLFNPLLGGEG